MADRSPTVRVRRDGPRGWHSIRVADYDPAVHKLYDPDDQDERAPARALAKSATPKAQLPRADWESMPWFSLRKHVKDVTGTLPRKKDHAIELMRRHEGAMK